MQKAHIGDYRTYLGDDGEGTLMFANENDIPLLLKFDGKSACVNARGSVALKKKNPIKW